MSAEQARRLPAVGRRESPEPRPAGDLPADVADDFLGQFIAKDYRSTKESNIELWCEQVLFNSAQQCADQELANDFIDELYQCRTSTTTDQLSTDDSSLPDSLSDGLSASALAGQPQAAHSPAGDDEVPGAVHTDHLAGEPASPAKQRKETNEFYGYEDHDYLKSPSNYLSNCASSSSSPQIDRPLNSIDEFMQLSELNAFQSTNLDLYVNAF